ncbi:hypothetical protein BN7_2747 [Wickerhamomyces ciferrii]|uniref:Uncharacterized protein n=1 Tax=Wickerhamomyces ciferrii (strain ATCC 14091 / BCRC 22168 / CBS 111 / JCM 3599 / NBRC 0793 / NRRL Y-1031 F-60-10) TaxID=1206466 RepID=K0KDK4_WICCF|nr:uncharacterized protein BN7_2747 [Wickerhamomyces ciferrii]CCH43200.1 hypothetical protein BN7_2747 [Wickerhamomyces ciferrii]
MVSALSEAFKDFRPNPPTFLPKDYPDLTDKVALITGTTSGIGYETAKALLKQKATVILINRSTTRSQDAVTKMKSELDVNINDDKIHLVEADLSDLGSIKPAIEKLIKETQINKIHYAIYNAGVMRPPRGTLTKQGYEAQIGINSLCHHLLNKFIEPLLLNAVDKSTNFNPRTIWIGSLAHFSSPKDGGIDWDSFQNAELSDSTVSYAQSKTANTYQSYIQSQRLKDQGVLSFTINPGYIGSDAARSMGSVVNYIWKKTTYHPVKGSYVVLFGALSPNIGLEDSGKYIGPWGEFRELREDIEAGFTNGTAAKFEKWADEQVEPYL